MVCENLSLFQLLVQWEAPGLNAPGHCQAVKETSGTLGSSFTVLSETLVCVIVCVLAYVCSGIQRTSRENPRS